MDIAAKLQEYDNAFDFYMDRGQMPKNIPHDDLFGRFIGQAIHDNPQIDNQDSFWKDFLKEEILKFIEAMLKIFQPIETEYSQEKLLIQAFANGEIEQKRKLWGQVYNLIKNKYPKEQVDIDGYVELLNQENTDTVLASLAKDWDKACDESLKQKEEKIIKCHKNNWEHNIREHGLSDYNEHKRIEKMVFSYPALVDILRIMGREQPKRNDELDETIKRYLPILPSLPKPATDINEVSIGQSLRHMMPIETVILSDHKTEDLFYLKFATHRLQLFSSKPKEESRLKIDKQRQLKPRLEKGPIIVSLDTSGSMSGRPLQLAKCLLLQLLKMAKKQKRKCFLITFSVRAKLLDLTKYGIWRDLNKLINNRFSGGTDGEEMLNHAIKLLQTDNFAMADILIISDFCFPKPIVETLKKMTNEHDKGTRFYGLQINNKSNSYNDILDKIWSVQTKNARNSG